MANRMTGLHLVTLPYEMTVITITRYEIRTPYQAADSDKLVGIEPYHLLVCSSYGTRARIKHVGYSKGLPRMLTLLTLVEVRRYRSNSCAQK